jgi:hypothetical protein
MDKSTLKDSNIAALQSTLGKVLYLYSESGHHTLLRLTHIRLEICFNRLIYTISILR